MGDSAVLRVDLNPSASAGAVPRAVRALYVCGPNLRGRTRCHGVCREPRRQSVYRDFLLRLLAGTGWDALSDCRSTPTAASVSIDDEHIGQLCLREVGYLWFTPVDGSQGR
jgi:hypothetical protein